MLLLLAFFSSQVLLYTHKNAMTEQHRPRVGLLCIDTQRAFRDISLFARERSNPDFEQNFTALLTAVRKLEGAKIFHVFHSSLNPSSHLHPSAGDGENIKFMDYAEPIRDEVVTMKHANSGFIGTDLEARIKAENIETLFVCGLILDHCVSTTTRMARDLGVTDVDGRKGRVILVQDATATFNRGDVPAEIVHKVSYESLRDEFAEIMNTNTVLESFKDL